MNLTDFSGQRPVKKGMDFNNVNIQVNDSYAPCVALNSLAWLARPTPPENLRKGITRLCSLTPPRYA